jgi:hypothetical protein
MKNSKEQQLNNRNKTENAADREKRKRAWDGQHIGRFWKPTGVPAGSSWFMVLRTKQEQGQSRDKTKQVRTEQTVTRAESIIRRRRRKKKKSSNSITTTTTTATTTTATMKQANKQK